MCNQQLILFFFGMILTAGLTLVFYRTLSQNGLGKSLDNLDKPATNVAKPITGRIGDDSVGLDKGMLNRAAIEEQILQSTIRIQIESWTVRDGEAGYDFDVLYSHATVKDGRYLVTHNHFTMPLQGQTGQDEPDTYRSVTLSDVAGQTLFQGPFSEFVVVWEDAETLVIGHEDGALFSQLGLVSAEFGNGTAVPLRPGMEVAQVDWDGTTTWVEWQTIEEVTDENGVPVLMLDGDIMVGASGGGVFWHGLHVANNWTVRQVVDGADVVVDSATKVALNSGVLFDD